MEESIRFSFCFFLKAQQEMDILYYIHISLPVKQKESGFPLEFIPHHDAGRE